MSAGVSAAVCSTDTPCGTPGAGDCVSLPFSPGFRCVCAAGFSGATCGSFNPCVVNNPCRNSGRCLNPSTGVYECR